MKLSSLATIGLVSFGLVIGTGGWAANCSKPQSGSSMILSSQEPAIVRFEPKMRVGGDLTPAILSDRLLGLVKSNDCKRIVWQNGRRWDAWGPGPVIAQGSRLMIMSSLLDTIPDYDIVWVVLLDGIPTYIADARRNEIYEGDIDAF